MVLIMRMLGLQMRQRKKWRFGGNVEELNLNIKTVDCIEVREMGSELAIWQTFNRFTIVLLLSFINESCCSYVGSYVFLYFIAFSSF